MREVTELPMRDVTEPPMRDVTEPPMREVTEPPMRDVTEPPMREVTASLADAGAVTHRSLTCACVQSQEPGWDGAQGCGRQRWQCFLRTQRVVHPCQPAPLSAGACCSTAA
jgi:hypothetical protein